MLLFQNQHLFYILLQYHYLNKYDKTYSIVKLADTGMDSNRDNNDEYKDIIKSNYQKMTYKVKNEEIDGDNAVVTVEIDVIDYTKGLDEIDNYYNENSDEFNDDNSFDKYRLDKFKEIKDKTTYTIDFTLTRINKKWNLDNPTSDIRNKISGMYK